MKVYISLITSIISFALIVYTQTNLLILMKSEMGSVSGYPTVISIDNEFKLLVIILALFSILFATFMVKEKKHKIQRQITLILSFLAILLCFVPFHLFVMG